MLVGGGGELVMRAQSLGRDYQKGFQGEEGMPCCGGLWDLGSIDEGNNLGSENGNLGILHCLVCCSQGKTALNDLGLFVFETVC